MRTSNTFPQIFTILPLFSVDIVFNLREYLSACKCAEVEAVGTRSDWRLVPGSERRSVSPDNSPRLWRRAEDVYIRNPPGLWRQGSFSDDPYRRPTGGRIAGAVQLVTGPRNFRREPGSQGTLQGSPRKDQGCPCPGGVRPGSAKRGRRRRALSRGGSASAASRVAGTQGYVSLA